MAGGPGGRCWACGLPGCEQRPPRVPSLQSYTIRPLELGEDRLSSVLGTGHPNLGEAPGPSPNLPGHLVIALANPGSESTYSGHWPMDLAGPDG